MTIFNIRGTNGSGKSTLVRKLLGVNPLEVKHYLYDTGRFNYTTQGKNHVAIGHYRKNCGGCDTIKTQHEIKQLIYIESSRMADPERLEKNILFEGVIVSTIYQPWADFDEAIGGMVWCYLDTPLDVCIQRVYERNGGKPIKEQLVIDKYKAIKRTSEKACKDGLKVVVLDHRNAETQIKELLNEAAYTF
jgi:thymidylate kinase